MENNQFNTNYTNAAAQQPQPQQMPAGYPYTYTQPVYSVPGNGYYYVPAQPPKKKMSTGLKVFFCVLACILVFGFGVMVSTMVKSASSSSKSEEPSSNASEEIDSLDENALKPGVDSGNNDLTIHFDTKQRKALTAAEIAAASDNTVLGISVYSTSGMLKGEASGIVAGINSKKTKTYIITCAHVVTDAEGRVFKVVDKTGKEYLAAVLGYDVSCDVAVLSVEKVGFKTARFGNSTQVKSGETVVAVGNPGGSEFFGTVTQGIVSATDRMLVSEENNISCIQHDAAINPGSSGGALFNVYGQVIGINYSKIAEQYYESMNFAVPSKTVVEKANQIIATGLKTKGAKIGVEYYVAASYFDENFKQYVIHSIDKSSDLYGKAEEGDFIIAVDGEKITDKYTVIKAMEGKGVGDTLTLTVAHKNEKTGEYDTKDVTVKLIEK